MELDFHGTTVSISSDSPDLLKNLARDFAYFAVPDHSALASPGRTADQADSSLELRACAPPKNRLPARQGLRWRSSSISSEGSLRRVDYEGRALLEYDLKAERGVLWSEDPDLMHELAYLAVLSRVGDLLDRKSLHRVHSLGFSFQGRGALLLLPMHGGKSRLGLELLRHEGFKLLSDDIPLLDGKGRTLVAFPLRLGLRGDDWRGVPERFVRPFKRRRFGLKHLVDVDYFRDKIAASAPLSCLLIGGRRDPGRPAIEPCSRAAAAGALMSHMVLGIGLPQVLELMLPLPPYLPGGLRLAGIAARRTSAALASSAHARCRRFLLSNDPADNAAALADFMARP
ncbi:MAG: hypothetical protein HZB91_04905 [Elusimicrobia bacterium]|nr:hypothetical protein [Elusimicrobiota bacterium]